MRRASRGAALLALVAGISTPVAAQTPSPFPRPGAPRPAAPPSSAPAPAPAPAAQAPQAAAAPTEATMGVPIFPNAQFLASYDAGQGQRYYLFGTNAPFADIVAYYRNVLKQRGELVYDEPPIHMFETGRFREDTMAFPPSVTVKDYTWGGSKGYLNPQRGQEPARFATVIQIVPDRP